MKKILVKILLHVLENILSKLGILSLGALLYFMLDIPLLSLEFWITVAVVWGCSLISETYGIARYRNRMMDDVKNGTSSNIDMSYFYKKRTSEKFKNKTHK